MQKNIKRLGIKAHIIAAALGIGLGWTLTNSSTVRAAGKGDGQDLQCKLVPQIQKLYLKRHVVYSDLSGTLEKKTVDQFIKRLDGAKIYLLQSDVDEIKKLMTNVYERVDKNDCKMIDDTYKIFLKRAQERADFAKSRLESDKWALDPKVEFVFDADKRTYPKTKKDAEDFQEKYLHYQVSNYIATGTKIEEAKKNVMKSYDRSLKQLKDKNTEDLLADYLDSYARSLDPHSTYFSKEGKEEFEIDMKLSLEGIGASLSWQDGFTIVEQLIEGGSAKKDGRIMAQDKIVAVGQFPSGVAAVTAEKDKDGEIKVEMENVIELPLKDVVRKIRGPKGTKVRLQVQRRKTDGSSENFFVTLVRDQIKLEEKAAKAQYIERSVDGKKKTVAVLNLPSFYADNDQGGRSSASDLKNLVREAREKNADAMVLDLSQNGGGSLEDAVRIAGLFFRTGAVVKQSSRDAEDSEELADRDPAVEWDGPLVVLTSRISASASEIVAGTLKDYKRAVIVGGDHTFGKGSVQQVFPLSRFGMVKVTVGMFFTPGGFSTQHRGVEADIPLPGHFSNDEVGEKSLDYSLPPKKIKPFLSEQAWVASGPGAWKKTDPKLLNALKERSKSRVSQNSEFKKILSELAKAKKNGKIVKISESLKEVKEKKSEADSKKNLSKEAQDAEYLKRADIQEAVNVAMDLWATQQGIRYGEIDKSIRLAESQLKATEKQAKADEVAKKKPALGDAGGSQETATRPEN